jgi:regulator of cell morphogenesis and NO signaling
MTTAAQTVRDIALEQPASIRVFEQYGIDYCCGGRKPLAEACAAHKLDVDAVLAALEDAAAGPAPAARDWTEASLENLVLHIVATHHAYVVQELPRLALLAEQVVRRHGDTQAELPQIQTLLAQLDQELTTHLQKEELILFPYIVKLERAATGGAALPHGCFGTVANPVSMMTQEHDAAGALLAEIRELSHEFTPPIGACPTYLAFFSGLKEFEQDLHQHIHLENNILFPGAIALETTLEATAGAASHA